LVSSNGNVCVNCYSVPIGWAWIFFGLSLAVVLISSIALCAASVDSCCLLGFVSFVTMVIFLLTATFTSAFCIWLAGGQTYTGPIYSEFLLLKQDIEVNLGNWAIDHPQDWYAWQTKYQCCGVGLLYCYHVSDCTVVDTGPTCNSTMEAQIHTFVIDNPTFNQTGSDNGPFGPYFCDVAISNTLAYYLTFVSIVLSVLCVVILVMFILSTVLCCSSQRTRYETRQIPQQPQPVVLTKQPVTEEDQIARV